MFAFAGLSLKSVEAVQAASFTLIFPFVFASSAFVPSSTFPDWLQSWSKVNPVSIWVDTFRDLTLGSLNPAGENLVTHLLQSTAWFLVILVIFVPLSVRLYRRT
jgi:ABC-type multidrug transport system permease subunit